MGKGEIALTSNFSFSHIVFKQLVLETCKNQGFFWERVKDHLGEHSQSIRNR